MNTVQNYVGRGSYANPHHNPATSGPPSSPTADLSAPITSEYVSINKDVLNAQEKIIALVFDYLGHIDSPVDALNDLLYGWLLTSPNWNKSFNARQLKTLLNLTGLLFDLQGRLTSLHYFENEAEKLQQGAQGGASHE